MFKTHAAAIEAALQNCAAVATHSFYTVELSPNMGYVEGEVLFVDGSRLIFFEFLRQSGATLNREKYRYHYMDANHQLIFRYDNAPHHLNDSSAPAFAVVLAEAEKRVPGIP